MSGQICIVIFQIIYPNVISIILCAHISAPVTDIMLTLTTPTNVTSTEPFKAANLTPLNWFEKRPHFATAAEQDSNTVQGKMYDGAIPIHINRIDPVSDAKYLSHVV